MGVVKKRGALGSDHSNEWSTARRGRQKEREGESESFCNTKDQLAGVEVDDGMKVTKRPVEGNK